MQIEAVDFFYVKMPDVTTEGDGSQDALLVRVAAGGYVGWGECEAAPLVSIASLVCPRSHGACQPVIASVLGQAFDTAADIARIARLVKRNSLDLLQTDHTLSGIEIALWDLLGKRRQEPVWRLLGYDRAYAKKPYASVLFGDTPEETLEKARGIRARNFKAAKFGWGPYGTGSVDADRDQVHAAREGLGPDGILLIDAGTVWEDDVQAAAARLPALAEAGATWLEEPFVSGAIEAYAALARQSPVRLAGGEGCHDVHMARHMIDGAGLGFVQIDTGRIGGIGPAFEVARHAAARGVTFVNHTFTSNLALSASLQPFAGLAGHEICEYPIETKPVARDLTVERLVPDADGMIRLPDRPGLGMTIDFETVRRYLVEVRIEVDGATLYETPPVPAG
ncbi:mandelate racemase/muconate lactonizing enzyme family protein (plasmid) [Skermanella rosea]|uniref:mandelate racemase/muconate lactonizing enzyme family protein n=1 Tax=Skermanella rosea TaxID=1817965 RepID=UPI0019342765|nr:mandelate racemase/muconate lactonizing enzyme family protein [Skermanella rosea]UEM07524.1 mandelate racemase/muconate lactonizing enzyme family protein [Skermanella rosea]